MEDDIMMDSNCCVITEGNTFEFGYSEDDYGITDPAPVCTVRTEGEIGSGSFLEEIVIAYFDHYQDILPEGAKGFWMKNVGKPLSGGDTPCYVFPGVFSGMDIRRMLAWLLYHISVDAETEGYQPEVKITELEIGGETFTDIEDIRAVVWMECNERSGLTVAEDEFDQYEDVRIVFRAKIGTDSVTALIPVNLNKNCSLLPRESTEGLYILQRKTENGTTIQQLQPYGYQHGAPEKARKRAGKKPYRLYQIDLFHGICTVGGKVRKGIFYYRNGELFSKYAVEEEKDGELRFLLSDIRAYFYRKVTEDGTPEKNGLPEGSHTCTVQKDSDKPGFELGLKPKERFFIDESSEKFFREWLTGGMPDINSAEKFENRFEERIVGSILHPESGTFIQRSSPPREYSIHKNGKTYCVELDKNGEMCFYGRFGEIETPLSDYPYFMFYLQDGELEVKKEGSSLRVNLDENKRVLKYACGEKRVRLYRRDLEEKIWLDIDIDFLKEKIEVRYSAIEAVSEFAKSRYEKLIALLERFDELCREEDTYRSLKEISLTEAQADMINIRQKLFPAPFVANEEVVKQVYEALKIFQSNPHKLIPNIVFLGGAGTGKTELADKVASLFEERGLRIVSAADLKGAYLGHTSIRVFDMLKEASEKDQIIFIDEAYVLMEDRFGQEAMAMLLPIMSGDRDYIEKTEYDQQNRPSSIRYTFRNRPAIWFAGYEKEMRVMLSQNPGLYRRTVKISLPSPVVDGLFENLLAKSDDYCRKVFEYCRKEIRDYFSWGIGKEYANEFGNYAGVKDFRDSCVVMLDHASQDEENREPGEREKQIVREVINRKKQELKKQYKAILTHSGQDKDGKYKFEVQTDIETTLADVMGYHSVTESLKDIVTMLFRKKEYADKGIVIPRGILMKGPSGTGKTLMAQATAGEVLREYKENEDKETRVAFIATASTELSSPDKIRALFSEAEEYDICIIFIDELDGIGKNRNAPGAYPALLLELMKEMDGFGGRDNILVMAATNDPDALDPALKRPGRFDRIVEIGYPEKEDRKEILAFYFKKLALFDKIGEEELEALTDELSGAARGFTPSGLKNLVNQAAMLYESCNRVPSDLKKEKCAHRMALKDSANPIEVFRCDIIEMLERLRVGEPGSYKKEESFQIYENEGCSAVAVHEVGHALMSILLGYEPFEKITVVPRGDALGYVIANQEQKLNTKQKLLDQIKICLGGRAAEELCYRDNISTGAAQDLLQAARYAENMLAVYGMSDVIGPIAVKNYYVGYLGVEAKFSCSDAFRYEIDKTVQQVLKEQMEITRTMLKSNQPLIAPLAEYVFEKETVTGTDFKRKFHEVHRDISDIWDSTEET